MALKNWLDVMENSSCELLSGSFPNVSELENLRWTILVNLVFNNFLSYTAIMLNVVTIHVIRKTSSLPNTLKTLLLNLAVTDVGVGLIVQPIYSSLLVRWLQQNIEDCNFRDVFVTILTTFCLTSFLGVVAVSADRFLAIHLHLRYQELVTPKRVVAVVISIWLLGVICPVVVLCLMPDMSSLLTLFGFVGLFLTTTVYIRIYFTARRHKNQIQALQVQDLGENNEMASFASLVKSAVGIFYVYLVFLICYMPLLICSVVSEINGPSVALKSWIIFSVTFLFLGSSLNPVIYCWKMRHIRRGIMDILQNMSWLRNRASHLS